jgi:predicted XRE-type DNA-binding protein
MPEKIRYEKSSGNVFADLDVGNPEEHLLKASLAIRLIELMGKLELTQTEAAARLGIKQPEVSRLKGGHLAHFSVERLLGFFNCLDQRVEIRITPARSRKRAETVLA